MAPCPFYREGTTSVERRKRSREGEVQPVPLITAPWCAHLYSPVTKYVAVVVAGGWGRLKCGGELGKCQVHPRRRPKL